MQRLADALPSGEPPAMTPGELPPETSSCATCHDGRFLRESADLRDPCFGKIAACPECNNEIGPAAGIPLIFQHATFETYDLRRNPETQPWYDACEGFAELPNSSLYMLMLHGDPGRGKTHLLVATLHELQRIGIAAIFWEVTELLAKLRSSIADNSVEAEIAAMANPDIVLALDDIGAHNPSNFAEESLYRIINKRWSNHAPTIATCNSSIEAIDPRVRSRFKGGWVYASGKDLRS